MRRRPIYVVLILLAALFASPSGQGLIAQQRDEALSDGEVEQLREAADTPDQRLLLFIRIHGARWFKIFG